MTTNPEKPKLAMYWAASCGGCEISVLNLGDRILVIDEIFDIVFFPAIADFKYDDLRSYPDGYIDLCLFNGAIRNSENEELAHLLRQKSKVMVAYGSCAYEGCIPALANLISRDFLLNTVYVNQPTNDNPNRIMPQPRYPMEEGVLELPAFYENVHSLDQIVEVDYYLPGCPPEPHQVWAVMQVVIQALTKGSPLPPKGAILGAGEVAVCEECPLEKHEKNITRFYRPYEITPEPDVCLLEQGLVCMGPATRNGCGALCPQVGMGCRGCYGPLPGVVDQGAKMISAIASVIDAGEPGMEEEAIEQAIKAVIDTIPDPAGTFYRFSMAHSLLFRAKTEQTST